MPLQIAATVEQAGTITNTATRTASSPMDANAGNDSDEIVIRVNAIKAMPWLQLLLLDD